MIFSLLIICCFGKNLAQAQIRDESIRVEETMQEESLKREQAIDLLPAKSNSRTVRGTVTGEDGGECQMSTADATQNTFSGNLTLKLKSVPRWIYVVVFLSIVCGLLVAAYFAFWRKTEEWKEPYVPTEYRYIAFKSQEEYFKRVRLSLLEYIRLGTNTIIKRPFLKHEEIMGFLQNFADFNDTVVEHLTVDDFKLEVDGQGRVVQNETDWFDALPQACKNILLNKINRSGNMDKYLNEYDQARRRGEDVGEFKEVVIGDFRPRLRNQRAIDDVTICIAYRHDGIPRIDGVSNTLNYLGDDPECLTFIPDGLLEELESAFINTDITQATPASITAKMVNLSNLNMDGTMWAACNVVGHIVHIKLNLTRLREIKTLARMEYTCSEIELSKELEHIYQQSRTGLRNAKLIARRKWSTIVKLWSYVQLVICILAMLAFSVLLTWLAVFVPVTTYRWLTDVKSETAPGNNGLNVIPGMIYGIDPVRVKVSEKPLKRHQWLSKGIQKDTCSIHFSDANFGHEENGVCYFDGKNVINKIASFEQRVLLSNITDNYNPDWKMIDEIVAELSERLEKYVDYTVDVRDIDVMEEYIMSRPNYNETEKKRIIKQFRETQGSTFREMLDCKSSRFTSFVKDEPYFSPNRPRPIQGASSFVKTYYGAVFHAIGEAFFSQEFATKKIPVKDRPGYITGRFAGFAYLAQTDHSAMESNATPELQRHTEMAVYKNLIPNFEHFEWFTEDKIIKLGIKEDDPMIKMEASRMSGAPNTSLGNSIINYVCLEQIRRHFNLTMDYVLEGDDALIGSMEPMDPEAIRSYAETQGYDLKIELRGNIWEAGYLSMTWDPETMDIQSFDFADALLRATIIDPQMKSRFKYWEIIAAKMLSLAANNPANPFAYALAQGAFRRADKGVLNKSFWNLYLLDSLQLNYSTVGDTIQFKGLPPEKEFMKVENYRRHLTQNDISIGYYDFIRTLLLNGTKKEYMEAIGYIIDIYKVNKPEYTDTRVNGGF